METKGISCKIPLELHERISEETAYEMTKLIYENVDTLKGLYAGFDIDPQASLDAIKIPLHPGAEKYYQELGLL